MARSLLKTTCFGLTILIPAEAAIKSGELFHVDVKEKPPVVAGIVPRPVLHLHSTGDGELPTYVHTGEGITMVNSIALNHGLLTTALPDGHLVYHAEGGRITFYFA
jgi:hypothetical protein